MECLGFIYADPANIATYRLVLDAKASDDGQEWETSLHLVSRFPNSEWCLSPSVAFRDITNSARSVILASGTLAPMTSFESELGAKVSLALKTVSSASRRISDA